MESMCLLHTSQSSGENLKRGQEGDEITQLPMDVIEQGTKYLDLVAEWAIPLVPCIIHQISIEKPLNFGYRPAMRSQCLWLH
jgi:hypothetical protein